MVDTNELIALGEGLKKLTAELAQKVKDYSAGLAANAAKKKELDELAAKMAEEKKKLEADQLIVSHITDVEAQRVQNQRDADANEKKANERKNDLDEQARQIDQRRQKVAADEANLAQDMAAYAEAVRQLEKDKANYKAEVLKGMGITVGK